MRLNAAVLGAGLMGRWHAHALRRIGARVASVVDPDAAAGSQLAGRYGAHFIPEVDRFFSAPACDVVHICTPVATHFEYAKRALEAGLHVLVEKPMAASEAEATQLTRSASDAGRLCCPVHQFPFQRGIARLRAELQRRSSGPLLAEFDIASAGGDNRPEEALDALLLEFLPHPLSILYALWPGVTGDAGDWQVKRPRPGQLIAHGVHAEIPVLIKLSLLARPTRCMMSVDHREGAVEHNFFHDYTVFQSPDVSKWNKLVSPMVHSGKVLSSATSNLLTRAVHRQWAYPGLEALLRQFYQAVASGGSPAAADDYIAVTRTCDIIRRQLGGD